MGSRRSIIPSRWIDLNVAIPECAFRIVLASRAYGMAFQGVLPASRVHYFLSPRVAPEFRFSTPQGFGDYRHCPVSRFCSSPCISLLPSLWLAVTRLGIRHGPKLQLSHPSMNNVMYQPRAQNAALMSIDFMNDKLKAFLHPRSDCSKVAVYFARRTP